MHRAAVVPHDQVSDAPVVVPGERRVRRVAPEAVQQRLGFLHPETLDVRIAPASEVEAASPCLRMGGDQRVQRSGRTTRIVGRGGALAYETTAVIGAVVFDSQVDDPLL